MRLLDITSFDETKEDYFTIEFVEEYDVQSVSYAIVSHRWLKEEVTLKDISNHTEKSRAGYAKLLGMIRLAKREGHNYLWMDTCCIDKDSSAELSEAINSMYFWYQTSKICYVYLHDVNRSMSDLDFNDNFSKSVWFSRGWTLQELLAPKQVVFYNNSWNPIGNKGSLCNIISRTTRIPAEVLIDNKFLDHTSIAARMSWAAGRKTQRVEDIAYSLMGIFSVNMPLLYGERHRAFQRLQEEIMRTSTDTSIFAWETFSDAFRTCHGLLADSPDDFRACVHIKSTSSAQVAPYSMTNRGLDLKLNILPGDKMAILDCHFSGHVEERVCIMVAQLPGTTDQYTRIIPDRLFTTKRTGKPARHYYPQRVIIPSYWKSYKFQAFMMAQDDYVPDMVYTRRDDPITGEVRFVEDSFEKLLLIAPQRTTRSILAVIAFRYSMAKTDEGFVMVLGTVADGSLAFVVTEAGLSTRQSTEPRVALMMSIVERVEHAYRESRHNDMTLSSATGRSMRREASNVELKSMSALVDAWQLKNLKAKVVGSWQLPGLQYVPLSWKSENKLLTAEQDGTKAHKITVSMRFMGIGETVRQGVQDFEVNRIRVTTKRELISETNPITASLQHHSQHTPQG